MSNINVYTHFPFFWQADRPTDGQHLDIETPLTEVKNPFCDDTLTEFLDGGFVKFDDLKGIATDTEIL